VKVDAPWGPEVPVRFRIDVAGRASMGTITARPPCPPRPLRRKFRQWLLTSKCTIGARPCWPGPASCDQRAAARSETSPPMARAVSWKCSRRPR
jgi:hypothetical protein